MIYKRFTFLVVFQVILLSLTPALFFLFISMDYMLISRISLCAIWVAQIVFLIHYLHKTNRDLSRFFLSFKYKDSTLVFNKKNKDTSFDKLHKSFNEIINAFGEIKIEKEKDYNFYNNTIQHIGIGILAFNENGDIKICNKAFKNLFNIKNISNISILEKIQTGLSSVVREIRSGKQELIKIVINNEILQISIKSEEFIIEEEKIKLVSFQNIKSEIEHGEVELWQKLIRILSHEILNSVSPVTLLSTSLINMFEDDEKPMPAENIDDKTVETTLLGLETIRKRSKGLSRFVEDYRDLTRLSPPQFTNIMVKNIFNQLEVLFNEDLKSKNIKLFTKVVPENINLMADEKLIEQMLINLIKNSIQALENTKKAVINIVCRMVENELVILVSDNGAGITDEIKNDIFIPFFSTKEKGSGIGLSLSRQIMRMHEGSISVISEPGVKTVFTLRF